MVTVEESHLDLVAVKDVHQISTRLHSALSVLFRWLPVVRARVLSSSESDSSGDKVRVFEMVAAVRLRRHCFVRRSRRGWV